MLNRLIHETSPYLLQHAHNPVDWFPYGDEVFAEAQRRNVPMLFSIGYSACHWCHVMEHESFEDQEIAALMNDNFVCVKVDREERPDVDHLYMDAVQLMQGRGGWPLNCFALPDGRPFWGGTYFRPEQWKEILVQVAELYRTRFADVEAQASEIVSGIAGQSLFEPQNEQAGFTKTSLENSFAKLQSQFDTVNGGFGRAPKFPMPVVLDFLLHYHSLTGNSDALQMVLKTLRSMAAGGIYDQAGGGFARYSVDAGWKVPHFEKMLYDNAQLVSLYCDAYKFTEKRQFRRIAEETLAFVGRELTSPEGVFYSALDADSEGEEGLYYTWTETEFKSVLGPYGELMAEYFGIGSEGLWEDGRNILVRPYDDALFAQRHFLSLDELRALVDKAGKDLLKAREKRSRPGLDDKVLTSWNALMIKAFADAGAAFRNEDYIHVAEKAASFILHNFVKTDGSLYHTRKNGKSRIDGFLDDHTFMAGALLRLYEVTAKEEWLKESQKITGYILNSFRDSASGLFFFSQAKAETIARKIETHDGVIPSSNSALARHLFRLGSLTGQRELLDKAAEMGTMLSGESPVYPMAYANWCSLGLETTSPYYVIAVAGQHAMEILRELGGHYIPNTIMAGSTTPNSLPFWQSKLTEGKTLIYICYGEACLAPVETVEEALRLIRDRQSSENSFTSLR